MSENNLFGEYEDENASPELVEDRQHNFAISKLTSLYQTSFIYLH